MVKFSDQESAEPDAPSDWLAKNNCQVPFGLSPLNSNSKVEVPHGPAVLKAVGAGDGNLSPQGYTA